MTFQVMSFMWLHTVSNYQWVHGGSLLSTLRHLYSVGGIARLYRGVAPTMVLSTLIRFGDISANAGCLAAFDEWQQRSGKSVSLSLQTASASVVAAAWRFLLTPIEVVKTNLMVSGTDAWAVLRSKFAQGGAKFAYYGSFAGVGVSAAAHFPWFYTYNHLQVAIPDGSDGISRNVRNGFIGFCASTVAACASNWIRVLKAVKQASPTVWTYNSGLREVLSHDGVYGLMTRGLGTRVLAQGLQGCVFTIVWKGIESGSKHARESLEVAEAQNMYDEE